MLICGDPPTMVTAELMSEDDHPGKRLRRARELAGFPTQKALWQAMGIPQPTYSQHETAGRGMTLRAAERYARFLRNVTAGWLLTGEGAPPTQLTRAAPKGHGELVVRRFRAARWAVNESLAETAAALGLSAEDLAAVEAGKAPLTDEILTRFAGVSGVPRRWLLGGSWEGLDPRISARAVYHDPGLLPEDPEGPSGGPQRQSQEQSEGGGET